MENYSEPELNLMEAAWTSLVTAQNNISIVARNHPISGEYLNGYVQRLDLYEKLLFPKMMFASVGGIYRETKCSICKKDYEDCEHMKGKMYKGQLCVREIHKMDLEEDSVVENLANKLCRYLTIKYDGKEVDLMTLKEKNYWQQCITAITGDLNSVQIHTELLTLVINPKIIVFLISN